MKILIIFFLIALVLISGCASKTGTPQDTSQSTPAASTSIKPASDNANPPSIPENAEGGGKNVLPGGYR